MKFLPLIFMNALRKKTRTLLTLGSIVLPLLVICLMGTFLKALEAPDPRTTRGSFRLVVRHRVSMTSILPTAFLRPAGTFAFGPPLSRWTRRCARDAAVES